MNLLLLSNSRNPGSGYLEHAREWFAEHLTGAGTLAFVPYAAVRFGYDEYEQSVASALNGIVKVTSVHRAEDPRSVVEASDAVAVGGGNTFRLLSEMYRFGLMESIRERALAGMPFSGWSAGSNVACPTIRTTNDMPIVEPPTFKALRLIPFQINPHYLDAHPDRHMGETREERIQEFSALNSVAVVGLREGSAIRLRGDNSVLLGNRSARIFRGGQSPTELEAGQSLDSLLS